MEARLKKKFKKEAQRLLKSLGDSSSTPEISHVIPNITSDIQEIKTNHQDIQSDIQEIHSENQEIQSHIQEIQSKAQEIQYQISKINVEIEAKRSEADAEDYLVKLERVHSILEEPCNSQKTLSDSENEKNLNDSDGCGNETNMESLDPESVWEMFANLTSILEKGHFTDVTIKCGNEILKAHKIVLCARSPVFEAMFTLPMQENDLSLVTVDDIDVMVFQDLLAYMYSGLVKDMSLTKASDLLYAAEKYQIKPLKKICVNYMRSNLSDENAFQILQLANLYDSKLKNDTMDYISEQFSVLEVQDDWKSIQLNNPSMALEVYSTVVKKLKNKS